MEHRLHTTLTALLAASLLVVSGCSQQPPVPAQGSIQSLPFSVVATGDSAADIRDASTFSWAPNLQQTTSTRNPGNLPVDALLEAAIIDTLQGKGYRYSATPGAGDLIVRYRVALDDARAGSTRRGAGHCSRPGSPDPSSRECAIVRRGSD